MLVEVTVNFLVCEAGARIRGLRAAASDAPQFALKMFIK